MLAGRRNMERTYDIEWSPARSRDGRICYRFGSLEKIRNSGCAVSALVTAKRNIQASIYDSEDRFRINIF
jgi:hypothetical protein